MKYMITLTDEQLKHFRLDDNGKTLVLTDVLGGTRAFPIEPIDGRFDYPACTVPKSMRYLLYCPYLQSLRAKMESEEEE